MPGWDRTLHGEVDQLGVGPGESVLVQGAVRSGTVAARGLLHVQGTVINATVTGGGQLFCSGAVTGALEVQPEGFALIQGTLIGTVRNSGVVILEGITLPGGGIEGLGRVAPIDEIPPEMRAMLPQLQTRIE
jgi:cytoskeletal protein CcmA (bactofilin family)